MNSKNIRTLLGLAGLVLAAWLTVILVYTDLGRNGLEIWGGIICALAAGVITTVSLLTQPPRRDPGTAEVAALPVMLSLIYFLLSMGLNTWFVLAGVYTTLPFVIANLALTIAFIACRIFLGNTVGGTEQKAVIVRQKTGANNLISAQLGVLLQRTEDADIRKALLSVREYVAYSSNMSTSASAAAEEKIQSAVSQLSQLMAQNPDKELVLAQIAVVSRLLKERAAPMV